MGMLNEIRRDVSLANGMILNPDLFDAQNTAQWRVITKHAPAMLPVVEAAVAYKAAFVANERDGNIARDRLFIALTALTKAAEDGN